MIVKLHSLLSVSFMVHSLALKKAVFWIPAEGDKGHINSHKTKTLSL